MHDDIGEVDRTARVAIAAKHRRRQQLNRRWDLPRELNVRQAADEPGINFAVAELIERSADNQFGIAAKLPAQSVDEELVDGKHVRRQERRNAQFVTHETHCAPRRTTSSDRDPDDALRR
jgi:hypothetical protein